MLIAGTAMAVLGCADTRPQTSDQSRSSPISKADSENLHRFIALSPSYQSLRTQSPNAAYWLDEETDEAWIVAIGENMDTHLHRWATLKIGESGSIWKSAVDSEGEETWVLEYDPARK